MSLQVLEGVQPPIFLEVQHFFLDGIQRKILLGVIIIIIFFGPFIFLVGVQEIFVVLGSIFFLNVQQLF